MRSRHLGLVLWDPLLTGDWDILLVSRMAGWYFKALVRQEGGMEMRVPGTSKVATPAWDPLELR